MSCTERLPYAMSSRLLLIITYLLHCCCRTIDKRLQNAGLRHSRNPTVTLTPHFHCEGGMKSSNWPLNWRRGTKFCSDHDSCHICIRLSKGRACITIQGKHLNNLQSRFSSVSLTWLWGEATAEDSVSCIPKHLCYWQLNRGVCKRNLRKVYFVPEFELLSEVKLHWEIIDSSCDSSSYSCSGKSYDFTWFTMRYFKVDD